MLVEPASLCWLAGRQVAARDGVTWAGEFRRWPALRAVVRDGGTGLSKGIELERARRREHQAVALEDGLDVFHTLREGGRALRATWAEASRALERAEAAQQRFDQRSRSGAVQQRPWGAVEADLGGGRGRVHAGRGGRSGLGPGPLGAGAVHARGPAQQPAGAEAIVAAVTQYVRMDLP